MNHGCGIQHSYMVYFGQHSTVSALGFFVYPDHWCSLSVYVCAYIGTMYMQCVHVCACIQIQYVPWLLSFWLSQLGLVSAVGLRSTEENPGWLFFSHYSSSHWLHLLF